MSYISFQPHDHFNTLLYTGNGASSRAVTGVGFQPDWVWFKNRDTADHHKLFDVVRGGNKVIYANLTNAQGTVTQELQSFDSDGFTVGTESAMNGNGNGIVAWNWKAGNSQGSSNTDGSINTTYTSVNTTAGFSISQYNGTGSVATIGHGLGVKPAFIIIKRIEANSTWRTYHKSLGATLNVPFENGAALDQDVIFNDTEPTTSVFTVGTTTDVNNNGTSHIAYCFAEKKGFSKFGEYEGNEVADGTFVYTGFKPAMIFIKNRGSSSKDWFIHDNKRLGYNEKNYGLFPNLTNSEATDINLDILSNGFKLRRSTAQLNHVGNFYIYMAFAEEPIVSSNGVAATAR